jgi:hypothetical protein
LNSAERELLRSRAGFRCEYWRLPEAFSPFLFQKDHVVARKHDGSDDSENLAWTCPDCNAHKGTDLTAIDPESGGVELLFNPRVQHWDQNFRWEGAIIVGKTPVGRATVRLLKMNLRERVALRRELMGADLW